MADYKIAGKRGACAACERSFDEDEAHVSLLLLRGDEPAREDLCQTCFAARGERGPGDVDLWWWRTRYHTRKKRGLALNLEAIEGLFLSLEAKLAGAETTTLSELRYILCLVLMRKRRLKIERIVRGQDGEAMIVRRPRRKEALRVAVHDFTPERTDELRTKLLRLFDGDEGDLPELDRGAAEFEPEAAEFEPEAAEFEPEAAEFEEAAAEEEAAGAGEASNSRPQTPPA